MNLRVRWPLLLMLVAACSRGPVADDGAVYQAFLHDRVRADTVLLQETTDSVTLGWFGGRAALDSAFAPGVREALDDLVSRNAAPRPLPSVPGTARTLRRIPAGRMRAIHASVRSGSDGPLSKRTVAVQLSAVGYSRDGTVAVVARSVVCGDLCGEYVLQAVRRHPSGWLAAEVLLDAVY